MPCPSIGPKMFWARPKIELHLVSLQKNCDGTKIEFTKCKSSFNLAQKDSGINTGLRYAY